MCSLPDYVAFFRPHKEMSDIMSELEQRLLEPNKPAFKTAAKAFSALMKTAKTLGMGIQTLMPTGLEMIDTWCRDRMDNNFDVKGSDSVAGLEHMYGAATALLTCHPESAIYDLAKTGRAMLKLAKRCYPNVRRKPNKEALVEYFLAHL
jgi:hypothetical protein